MTSAEPEIYTAKPPRRRVLPWWLGAILALAVVIVIGVVLVSRFGVDRALVKKRLDLFIATAHEDARARGRDLSMTYGELEMTGGLAHRHVRVHDIAITVKPLQQAPLAPGEMRKSEAIVITTPAIELFPEAADLSALRIEFGQPLNFASQDAPDKSLMKIAGATPFAIHVAQDSVDKTAYTRVNYAIPAQVDFTYLREDQAKGTEDATPQLQAVYETMRMATAPGATVETHFANDGSRLGTAHVAISQVTLTPQAALIGSVAIAGISGDWSNTVDAQKQSAIHSTVDVGPITAPAELLPFAPVAFHFDASYQSSPLTLSAPTATTPPGSATPEQQAVMTLKTFALTTKDAAINATANFTATAADVLPVGNANIAITNVPFVMGELRSNAVIDPAREELVTAALQLITGTPAAELKDATIAIERTRGGAFKIGQTTFEELFATFLKMALKHKADLPGDVPSSSVPAPNPAAPATVPVPQLPDPAKPKPAAQPIHDPSTRG